MIGRTDVEREIVDDESMLEQVSGLRAGLPARVRYRVAAYMLQAAR